MSSGHTGSLVLRHILPIAALTLLCGNPASAQEAPPPAYLAVVEGAATLERDGELLPATQNMPFVTGDRLRTANGRVEIAFPDGSAIEVAEYSEVECLSATRVRLIAGTMDHLQRDLTRSVSAQYLPQELDVYGNALDQNGAWQYAAPYGYVWYPTVAPDWRPYYQGYWSPMRTYGWTWIGADPWAWPTHHYGRWGHASNRWFWIPGRTWGPAWVSWASASDYVSWCPLGFDSRPVFDLSVGYRNARAGWIVLPRANFGMHQYYANRYAIDARRIPVNTPFIAHQTPPIPSARGSRARVDAGRDAAGAGIGAPRTSPLPGRRALDTRQAPVVGRQPLNTGAPQPPATTRQTPPDARRPGDARWSRTPQGVETHYGIAVPRTIVAPPVGGQRTAPDVQAPPGEYRPAVPGYRTPNNYRIQRMDPRLMTPGPAAPQAPPAGGAQYVRPAPPQMAVPRSGPPPAPAANPPAQAAPQAAPPPARSAPRGQAPQGEARPRAEARPAEARPAESRRPR
jgi:hypothetical protein